MALELVGGAVLGVLFGQLEKEIWSVKDNFVTFKPKLEELEETLTLLYPVIEEIEELNRRLNRPNHGRETIILRKLLEDGTKLVSKCSKIPRWDIFKQGRYRGKLVELDNKILRFHNLYMQAHMGRDQKQTLLVVQETKQMVITSLNQQGFSNLTMAFIDSSNITVGITASNTGSYFKVVIKAEMHRQKCRSKALKVAALVDGVNFVGFEEDHKEKLVVVVGGRVDAVQLTNCLRKRVGYAFIVSVEKTKHHLEYETVGKPQHHLEYESVGKQLKLWFQKIFSIKRNKTPLIYLYIMLCFFPLFFLFSEFVVQH